MGITKSTNELNKTWLDSLHAWRSQYAASMGAPYGWWSIVGLDWLEPGENLLGSAAEATLRLPARFPARTAILTLGDDGVTVAALADVLTVEDVALERPHTFTTDTTLFARDEEAPAKVNLIQRGDLWGVRVHDPLADTVRDPGTGVAWFDVDPAWRLDAEFLPPEKDELVAVQNRIGQTNYEPVKGRVVFQHEQQRYTLLATAARDGGLFLNFQDATNEGISYSGGRFLTTEAPVNGRLTVDFNRAHHPPCAHTTYATCPMPTPGNRLPFGVTAGERTAQG